MTLQLLSVAALLSAASAAPARVDVAGDRAALFRADKAWSQAAARRDVEEVLSFWTDDASVFPPGQPPVVGKEALRRYVTGGFAMPGFSIQWETSAFEVSAAGDIAYGVGTNVVTINDPQGKTDHRAGTRRYRVAQGNGRPWRCVVDIWNAGPAFRRRGTESADDGRGLPGDGARLSGDVRGRAHGAPGLLASAGGRSSPRCGRRKTGESSS